MEENNYVVVEKVEGSHQRLVRLVPGRLVSVEKLKFFPDKAIGAPYDGVWEVRERGLVRLEGALGNGCPATDAAVAASENYDAKTEHAKDKYVRKKRAQFSSVVRLLRPSPRLLASVFYAKDTDKAPPLHSIAALLHHANVGHGSVVGVVEQCAGLVTAACLERLGGAGRLLNFHKQPVLQAMPALEACNFPAASLACLLPVPLRHLLERGGEGRPGLPRLLDDKDDEREARTPEEAEKAERRAERLAKLREAEGILQAQGLQGLVLATRTLRPLDLVRRLLPLVQPSSPLAVYHMCAEPLVEVFEELRSSEAAVDLRLTDSTFRQIQVMPGRTHPEMTQLVAGGFLLTGYAVRHRHRKDHG